MIDAELKRAQRLRLGLYIGALSIGALLSIVLLLGAYGVMSGLYLFIPVTLLLITLFAIMLMAVIFRKKIWLSDPNVENEKALNIKIANFLNEAVKHSIRIDRRQIRVPWNIFISPYLTSHPKTMIELGYAKFSETFVYKGIHISTWGSSSAIAIRIELDSENLSQDLINAITKHLVQIRPIMPINAIFAELRLGELCSLESANTAKITAINTLVGQVIERVGINLPINIALEGLEQMQDIERALVLTDAFPEGTLLGGFIVKDSSDSVSGAQRLFNDLSDRLEKIKLNALFEQISSENCKSIVIAPLQLQAILALLKPTLFILTKPMPPRKEQLNLNSIAFIGSSSQRTVIDPLAQFAAQRFFQGSVQDSENLLQNNITSYYAKDLAVAYRLNNFSAGSNVRELLKHRFRSGLVSIFLIVSLLLYSYVSWFNYNVYQAANADLDLHFQEYYLDIAEIDQSSDTLITRIVALDNLREGLAAYGAVETYYSPTWMPNWSLEGFYRSLYERELVGGYQFALADHLQRDMFEYNELSDGVKLLSLAVTEKYFFSNQDKYKDRLISYFLDSFADEGEILPQFVKSFKATAIDLFTVNQPALNQRNTKLNELIKNTIVSQNSVDLLYQSILTKQPFQDIVDLHIQLGPRIFEVFETPSDKTGHLIKRAFTRSGFNLMFREGEILVLKELINDYQDLLGTMDGALVDIIERRIAERYINDYINAWKKFLLELEIKQVSDWSDSQLLITSLNNPTENPFKNFLDVLKFNTQDIYLKLNTAESKPNNKNEKVQKFENPYILEQNFADKIQSEFKDYFALEKVNKNSLTQLEIMLLYVGDISLWIETATKSKVGISGFLFDQYSKNKGSSPVDILQAFATRSNLPLVRSFGLSISETLESSSNTFIVDFINDKWTQEVYRPYAMLILSNFPFRRDAVNSISLAQFTEIFGVNGKIQKFKTKYLNVFLSDSNGFQIINNFAQNKNIRMKSQAIKMMEIADQYANHMFVSGKPMVSFGLRIGRMHPNLSKVSLTSENILHKFSHGPIRWSFQDWPLMDAKNSVMILRIHNRSRISTKAKFNGPWSWFRMLEFGERSMNKKLGLAETLITSPAGNVTYQIDSLNAVNPFEPNFFTRFNLATDLF